MMTLTGSCNCKAVQYRVSGPFRKVLACHCDQCRKYTGHHFAASAVRRENFDLIEDAGLKWYRSSAQSRRGFCADCGSSLFFEREGSGQISFSAGTIDGPSGLEFGAHIFALEKGDYYTLPEEDLILEASDPSLLKVES